MNRDIQQLAAVVRDYVHTERAAALAAFEWTLNERVLAEQLGLQVNGLTSYEKNIDLKVKLYRLWQSGDQAQRQRIARYYVVSWGGIKRNAQDRLSEYVNAACAGALPPAQGVASWSKVFAAADPHNHAIFDARVSLSLNALQFLRQHSPRWRFPVLPSQNNLVREAGPRLAHRAEQAGRGLIPRALAYPTYMRILRIAAPGLPGPLPFATAEMVLFSRTEELADQVG